MRFRFANMSPTGDGEVVVPIICSSLGQLPLSLTIKARSIKKDLQTEIQRLAPSIFSSLVTNNTIGPELVSHIEFYAPAEDTDDCKNVLFVTSLLSNPVVPVQPK